ncbi:MAG: anti-sigma-K factor RskA [Candidatus Paceibacteria bacterium]|jgi:anti-sigma-K factor RskA
MNEQTLTFYYYDDGLDEDERRAVELALASDPQLAQQYQRLAAELDALLGSASAPAEAPSHLRAQWHDVVDRAAQQEAALSRPVVAPKSWFHAASFFWGGALTASLVLGVTIGVYMTAEQGPGAATGPLLAAADPVTAADSGAFSRGLLLHFQDSRRQLAALPATENGERSELIFELVAQNRLFERAAEQSDAQDLARVLRAFEPVLLRLIEEDLPATEMAALRSQLGFELNIMLTKLAVELSDKADTIET